MYSKIFKSIKAILLACFLLSFSLIHTVFAGEDFPADAEIVEQNERWYQVELVIFKQRPMKNTIEEVWPKDIILKYPDTWVKPKTADQYIKNPYPTSILKTWLDRIQSSPMTPFVLLEDTEKTLLQIAKKNHRLPGKIIFHESWWQPFIKNDKQDPIGILIQAGEKSGNHYELEGSISLKLTRYLHFKTNLWLTKFSKETDNQNSFNWFGAGLSEEQSPWPKLPPIPFEESPSEVQEQATDNEFLESEKPVIPNYKIKEIISIKQSRRMRSNKIHYLDHPKIGILVRLTPYEGKLFENNAEKAKK